MTIAGMNETTRFFYDNHQQFQSTVGPRDGITEFYYTEQGLLQRTKAGTTHINQEFDDAGRVTQQTILANTPLRVNYTYEPSGYIQTYQEGNNLHQYAYDFAGRLESWTNQGTTVTYNYDKSGNILNPNGKQFTFNDANEIVGFSYDQAGNLLQDDKYQYTWDQLGQITSIQQLNGTPIAS